MSSYRTPQSTGSDISSTEASGLEGLKSNLARRRQGGRRPLLSLFTLRFHTHYLVHGNYLKDIRWMMLIHFQASLETGTPL